MLSWTSPGSSDVVIDRLSRILGVNAEGNVTLGWTPGVFESLAELLAEQISYSPELSVASRARITRRSLLDAKKGGDFTAKRILKLANEKQAEFLRTPLQAFTMLTSASIEYADYLKPVVIGDATISFLPERPNKFAKIQNQGRDVRYAVPLRQTHITVEVVARDAIEAADSAFKRLLLWRGIWNLYLNSRTEMRISFGGYTRKPISRILPGPLYTMHHPDGTLAMAERWWFSPGLESIRPESLKPYYESIKKFERWVHGRLKRASFADDLTRLLALYCSACDEPELSSAYLAMWSVLEHITGTDKKSYDDLLRRASFLSHDPPFERQLLEHLRNQRNAMVHHGVSLDDPERVVYQLKQYVEFGLRFMLRHAPRFQSVGEFRAFLDLPPDEKVLANRLRLHRWAQRMRERWRKAADEPDQKANQT